jgi:putative spermidine/putrescine transport system permease protein
VTARILAALLLGFVAAYLLAPLVVVIGASFSGPETGGLFISYVEFPPRHLTLQWYRAISAETYRSLLLSIGLAAAAAVCACALGVPAALGLVRGEFRGRAAAHALFRAPLQIPAVVTGIGFLQMFYVVSDATGLALQGSFAGLLLAHVFLATPFVIGSVAAVLARFDVRLEEAALTLGASRVRTFRRVTLPIIMPGVATGAVYGFLVSFVDVPVSLFLSRPELVPYPVALFDAMQQEFSPAILASATLVVLLSLLILLAVHWLVGLDALLKSQL